MNLLIRLPHSLPVGKRMARDGTFRADPFYRLRIVQVAVPPLMLAPPGT